MEVGLLQGMRGAVGGVMGAWLVRKRRAMNVACCSSMAFCKALSFWRRVALSSVMAAGSSVALSKAPSKLLVYSSSEWWPAVDKGDVMLCGTCGGLLDGQLLLSKKLLALSYPPERAVHSTLNFSLLL